VEDGEDDVDGMESSEGDDEEEAERRLLREAAMASTVGRFSSSTSEIGRRAELSRKY